MTAARVAVAVALVWWVVAGPNALPSPSPRQAYTGPMQTVHTAAAGMDARDRQGLAEALAAAGKMIEDDKAGLLTTTEAVQKAARGAIAYGYTSFAVGKYPEVARAIQDELERATGGLSAPATPALRQRVASTLDEAAKAVR